MGDRTVQAGGVLTGVLGVALVAFGGYRLQYGTGTVEELIAFAFVAVTLVAGYRSVTVDSGPRVNALGNVALFVAAVATYGGGLNFGVDPALTVGQALFAIALGYFLVRQI